MKLERLLKKKKFSKRIEDFLTLSNISLSIKDNNGKILFEHGEGKKEKHYPLQFGENIAGIASTEDGADKVIDFLHFMISSEYEKKALVNETLEKYKEITHLHNISKRLSRCHDRKEVAELVIDEAGKEIEFSGISIMYLDKETQMLQILASSNEPCFSISVAEGIAGSIVAKGKAEIVNNVDKDPRFVPRPNKISAIMCAPLKIKEEVIGVINVHSETPHQYSTNDLKFISILATQSAIAIENAKLYEELKNNFLETVHTLAETIEKRDPYTGGHTARVSKISIIIGQKLGIEGEELENLSLAAILHDIGKIGVRDKTLLKEGALDDTEYLEMKQHPTYGEEILRPTQLLREIVAGVKHHHERFDGHGYPDGLKGEDIPQHARIICIADAYDAITSDRPYRKGLTKEFAIAELKKGAGTQFDPQLVELLCKHLAQNPDT